MKAITRFSGEYEFLSNFYIVPVRWDNRVYTSSEAAFQSAKTLDPTIREQFAEMTPSEAKRRGRKVVLRDDWESVKDKVMRDVVTAKFVQHPELAIKLLDTGDATLLEGNSWHDTYWGVDEHTLKGQNHLGKILMDIRDKLKV